MGCLSTKETVTNQVQPSEEHKYEQDVTDPSISKMEMKHDKNKVDKDKPVWMTWADRPSISNDDEALKKMYDLDNRFGKMIHGYIMVHIQSEYIPSDVHNLIWQYLPKRLKFEDFNHDRFRVYDEGHEIKGLDSYNIDEQETAYQMDLEPLYKDAMCRGVHYLSIQTRGSSLCIGIKKDKQYINTQKGWAYTTKGLSYYYLIDPEQPHSAIYTVKFDCDNWTLSCYRGWTMIKQDSIEPSKYFFGINARSYNDTKITIIDPIRIQYNFESQFCAIEDELY